jgi:hypothetical protein
MSHAQGTYTEEGSIMAIILIEEVLMGLDEVKASFEQAMTVLDVLVDALSPVLGEGFRAELEHTLRQPLRGRLEVLEHLQAMVDALAASGQSVGTFYVLVSRQLASIGRGSRRVAWRPGTGVVPGSADGATAAVRILLRKERFVVEGH